MKILFVIDDYSSSNNGTSISAQRFVGELRRQGHDVRVMSTIGDGIANIDYELNERHIYPFDNLIHSYGFHFAATDKQLMRKAIAWCDIVHFMMPFGISHFGKQVADELGKPATIAFHIQPENILSGANLGKVNMLVNATYTMWRKMLYCKFAHIHCPSNFMRNMMIRHGYEGDICAISNGIAEEFVWTKAERTEFDKEAIVITMVGRLAHEKRQDLIIEAAKKSKYAERIQLVFAGNGPLKDDYIRMSKKLKRQPIFGYYTKQQLINILGQTDLYIHASDMESEAISCIEAFATGLVPVISNSSNSATKQFALDERSLFEAGDSDSLARKIDYWLDRPEEKAEMERTYAAHADKYRLEPSVRAFVAMLKSEIADHKATNTVEVIEPAYTSKHPAFLRRIALLTAFLFSFGLGIMRARAGEVVKPMQYGNFDTWTVRMIKESALIGGSTRTIYAVGPNDTIMGNKAWNPKQKGIIWSNSNVYAKVVGVSKASCTVFPEKRDNGYCARLENRLEEVNAFGVIHLKVLASGTIYTGTTLEPVNKQGADDPYSVLDAGSPFTGHPTALMFDYKATVSQERTVTYAKATSRPIEKPGFDCPQITVLLQRRWEDAHGNIHADRVGTGVMRVTSTETTWQNEHRLPIIWGDASDLTAKYPGAAVGQVQFKAKNSNGKMVDIQEEGYVNGQPTHIIIQFSAGCMEAFVGHAGNTLWIDNVKLVYNE